MLEGVSGLDCHELTKFYKGNRKALDAVSFSIPAKGIFALIGRNGAGKTTLIRILATELEPTSGSARMNGLDVMRDASKVREVIAIVPQEARTVAWMTPKQTVMSYLMWRGFGHGDARRRAEEALGRLGLEKQSDVMNRTLSGGTKRKVLVATVLASEASILFLDEPTTGLDPISRREFWDILRSLGTDHFVFLTTHYLEEAEQLADDIGVLKDGRLIASGTLAELRKRTKYGYSIKLPPHVAPSGQVEGEVTSGRDGSTQILTHEDEAFRISRTLAERGDRFSISPVSLDDIFFRLAGETARDDGAS